MKPAEKKSEKYPAVIEHLPKQFVMEAEIELLETPEAIDLRVKQVKNLLANANDVKLEWFGEKDIIMYLRCRKYDVEKAVRSMKAIVGFIKKRQNLFEPIDNKMLEKVFKEDAFSVLPYRTEDGTVIALSKLRSWEPSQMCVYDYYKCICQIALYYTTYPMSQVEGAILIYDFKTPSWKYAKYCTPFYAYLLYQVAIECIPLRLRAIHVVNTNGLAKMMLPMLRVFLPDKINKRIYIHDDPCDVRNFIDADVLPSEYGGKLSKQERNDLADISKITMPDYLTKIVNHFKSAN